MRKKRNEKRNCLISRNNRIFLNKRLSQAKREMVKNLTIRKRMINIYIHKKWIVMYRHNVSVNSVGGLRKVQRYERILLYSSGKYTRLS